jgi:octaprenyl-diphosphate synthase
VDDALDYAADQEALGKTVGDDFREGKITLPVLLAFARGSEEERGFWRRVLEAGDQQEADLATAMALMTKYDTIGETITRARRYGEKAISALDIFADSQERRAMVDVVRFCIDRAR